MTGVRPSVPDTDSAGPETPSGPADTMEAAG